MASLQQIPELETKKQVVTTRGGGASRKMSKQILLSHNHIETNQFSIDQPPARTPMNRVPKRYIQKVLQKN